MEELIRDILERAERIPDAALFGAMLLGAFLEYVFPPVPGDLWTAGGAILVARGQSFWMVFLGVNTGSVLGFLLDYAFGAWLANPRRRFRHWGPSWERMGRGIDRVAEGFSRHPAFYLFLNRFLPGIRALVFVAAGFARVSLWKVLLFGVLSSLAWNLLLVGLGYTVGMNLDLLLTWLSRYTWAVWAVLVVVLGAVVLRVWRARRRGKVPAGGQEPVPPGPGTSPPGPPARTSSSSSKLR